MLLFSIRKALLVSTFILCFLDVDAQPVGRFVIFVFEPRMDLQKSELIRNENIAVDSVFYYRKKNNNKDSSLYQVLYFDKSGNIDSSFAFQPGKRGFSKMVFQRDGELTIATETSTFEGTPSACILKKTVVSKYKYDDRKNLVEQTDQMFLTDPPEYFPSRVTRFEYDEDDKLMSTFRSSDDSSFYLTAKYHYNDGKINEIKNFNKDGKWYSSTMYEYPEGDAVIRVYKKTEQKELEKEQTFDKQKRLIIERKFDADFPNIRNSSFQRFFYNPNDLIESQSLKDAAGEMHYFRHFYYQTTIK